MKKLLTVLIFFLYSFSAKAADIYHLDPNHTNITWVASHFGFSNSSGKFLKSEGTIILDDKQPDKSYAEVIIYTGSSNSGIDKLDEHLRGEDFFNTNLFPTAKFISKEITLVGSNKAIVKGNFTMLGITKPIKLEARLNKLAISPITQKKTAGFSAATIIKRSDFGMTYGIPGVSDNIKINIEAEAIFSSAQSIEKAAESGDENGVGNITYIANPKWNLVAEESLVSFSTKQKGSVIKGSFKKINGSIFFNKNEQSGNKVRIEIDTNSIEMSFTELLKTIKTAPWLAIEEFPKAVFVAENFKTVSDKKFQAEGNLTIKNKTVPVNFTFDFRKYSKTEAIATGSFSINRRDFDVGSNDRNVDDEVVINFNIKARK